MSGYDDLPLWAFAPQPPPPPLPPPEHIEPSRRFDGETYEPVRDADRLTGQLRRVWNVASDGRWRTLATIADLAAPATEAAVSARLRDFRKARYGAHVVERRRVEGRQGLWEYRLVVRAGGAA